MNSFRAADGARLVYRDEGEGLPLLALAGLTRDGRPYPLARVVTQTEPAGACFSPDGKVLFVNLYSPAATLAITGPWQHLRA